MNSSATTRIGRVADGVVPPHAATASPDRATARSRASAVDAAPARAGHTYLPTPAAEGRPASGSTHPRRHRRGQEQRRLHPGQAQRHRRGGVAEPAQDPGPRRADAEPPGQPERAEERGDQHRADPQPLDHPRRQPGQLAEQEVRAHREQVADGLVLQLAELVRVPQGERAGQEPGRVDGQVQLGVRDEVTGRADERQHEQQRQNAVTRIRSRIRSSPPAVTTAATGRSGASISTAYFTTVISTTAGPDPPARATSRPRSPPRPARPSAPHWHPS